ncbi:MAG: DUF2330 domain-containing protein [Microbacteriaceae bacterium]
MRRILALGIFTVALVAFPVAAPAFACECGGVVQPTNGEVSVDGERAILSLVDGIQTTELLMEISSTSANVGLIVPTPTPATVELGDLRDFDAIESAMLPRPVYVEDWWGIDAVVSAVRNDNPTIPTVLDRVQLGPLEATTLAASDTQGLLSWLVANDFTLPETAQSLLQPYVTAGWSFVAIKLSSASALDGTLDPVRISFATEELVYPTRLFQSYTKAHSVRLYVVGDDRVELAGAPSTDSKAKAINAAQKTVWAAQLLDGEPQSGRFLTVFDVTFDDPPKQATSDIYFPKAKANDEVVSSITVVRPMTLLGVPFGTVLVGSAIVALLALIGFFVARVRVR